MRKNVYTAVLCNLLFISANAQVLEQGINIPRNSNTEIQDFRVEAIFPQADGSVDVLMYWDNGKQIVQFGGGRYFTHVNEDGIITGYSPVVGPSPNTPMHFYKAVEVKSGCYFQYATFSAVSLLEIAIAQPSINYAKKLSKLGFVLISKKPVYKEDFCYLLTIIGGVSDSGTVLQGGFIGLLKVNYTNLSVDTLSSILDNYAVNRWRGGTLKVDELAKEFTWYTGDSVFTYDISAKLKAKKKSGHA